MERTSTNTGRCSKDDTTMFKGQKNFFPLRRFCNLRGWGGLSAKSIGEKVWQPASARGFGIA
jgi:hypothetical protein